MPHVKLTVRDHSSIPAVFILEDIPEPDVMGLVHTLAKARKVNDRHVGPYAPHGHGREVLVTEPTESIDISVIEEDGVVFTKRQAAEEDARLKQEEAERKAQEAKEAELTAANVEDD